MPGAITLRACFLFVLLFSFLLVLELYQCTHPYLSTLPSPRSGQRTNPAPADPYHPGYPVRYSLQSLLSSIPGCALALACVLPSSVHAKTHHPRRLRYYILGWRYRESRGAAYRSAYTETPDAIDALPKGLPPCLASGGHETSVWMFPGSYHMILDVSFGFITVSEVSHPHKQSYYRRRCTVKASADSIVYCGPGDFQAYSTVVQLLDSTRPDHPHNLLR